MMRPRFVSYAQNAEDVVLARALQPEERPGFWIDVGAGDPVVDSVTAAFSERGWTGINVEPLPQCFERLVDARPDDVNLRCALGDVSGVAKLYPGPAESEGLATLVPEVAEMHRRDGLDLPESIEVQVRTLDDIVAAHAEARVDFLKVDVEGYEHQVLAGVDWASFCPRIVVVEATFPGTAQPTHESWEPLLLQHGYRFVLFDGLNRFYAAAGEHQLASRLAAPANVLDDFVPAHWAREFARVEEYARDLDAALRALQTRSEEEHRSLTRAARYNSARAEIADALTVDLQDELTALQIRTAQALGDTARLREAARQEMEELRRLIDALENTRTLRYTASLRRAYARLRRMNDLD